tara:strand:- start:590 stop:1045 length:456 start_codon:yes stop_codon:yes gene_type:complete
MKKDIDFEGLICPACSSPLDEELIKESLVCIHCKADLQDSKYLDFIEYLVANGIVKDIDFFDMKIYRDEIERLDPTDSEDVDPQDFEKKKDNFSLFVEEVQTVEKDTTEEIDVWEGLEEDWEEFNLRNQGDDEDPLLKKKEKGRRGRKKKS